MEDVIDNDAKAASSNNSIKSELIQSNAEVNKRKRRSSDAGDADHSAKKFLADDESPTFNLLDFSDEVLLEIFLNCNSLTLYALSKTCKHFRKLIEDRRLWKVFDFSKKRLTGKQLKQLLTTIQISDVKEFKLRGLVSKYPLDKWKNNTISTSILRKLTQNCPQLESLEICDGYINFLKIKISDFPSTLKRLIFNGCQITMPRSPRLFTKVDHHLQLLEELSLEKCPWFETHDLVVFSKLPHLKRLNLRGCNSLKGCVPYGSIATRFGFKSLEYLDIRDTPIADSDVQCFNVCSTLREILMDCPIALRDNDGSSTTSDETWSLAMSDDDETSGNKTPNSPKENVDDGKDNAADCHDNDKVESESEWGSDLSDSDENENDGADDDPSKANANNEDANVPPHSHCIQVILQNGRLINVNTERPNENEPSMREMPNALRCVIGVVNGRDRDEALQRFIVNRDEVVHMRMRSGNENRSAADADQNQEAQAASSKQSKNDSQDDIKNEVKNQNNGNSSSSSSSSSSNSNEAQGSNNQPGPSSSNKADESDPNKQNNATSSKNNSADEVAGPSNSNPNSARNANPVIEDRGGVIIVQRHPNNMDGDHINFSRRISWEVQNMHRSSEPFARGSVVSNSSYISDRGLCSFGMPRRNVQEGIVWIRAELRPADTLLERITVRNYRSVTDVSLRHLAICAPNLQYLDVTGTSVTRKGINIFLASKPDCHVVSDLIN